MERTWKPRMLPPMWVAVAIAAMWALHRWLPGAQLLDDAWRWIGIVPIAVGTFVAFWGERQFAKAHTGVIPGREITTFVRTGPYRFTRNPMYLGMTLALAGVAAAFGSATGFVVPIAFVAVIEWRFIRNEEQMLRDRFGDDAFEQYASEVRRWI